MQDKIIKFKDRTGSSLSAYITLICRGYANKSKLTLKEFLTIMWESSSFPHELLKRSEIVKIYDNHKDDVDSLVVGNQLDKDVCRKAFMAISMCIVTLSSSFDIYPQDFGFTSFFDAFKDIDIE